MPTLRGIQDLLSSIQPASVHVARLSREEAGWIVTGLRGEGIEAVSIDGSQIVDEASLFRELALAWDFPNYFGYNWHAVDDCLLDLGTRDSTGFVTVVTSAEALFDHLDLLRDVVSTFLRAGEAWATAGSSSPLRRGPAAFHLLMILQPD